MASSRALVLAFLACLALGCRGQQNGHETALSREAAREERASTVASGEPPAPPPKVASPRCTFARAPAPEAGDDLLFYVNRVHAIPSEYPLSSASVWTPCAYEPAPSAKKHDLLCLPAAYTFHAREALRRAAFESEAPPGMPATHDARTVGRDGKVGVKPLLDAAREAGFDVYVRSGFRAYATQSATFAMWVAQELIQGRNRQDALARVTGFSARAGHSEHQLGTTVDLVYRAENGIVYDGWDAKTIAASAAMRWVTANAHRFGVVLTYDEGREEITQYVWEPWHFRYVGVEAADAMHACGLSTEAYLQARYGAAPPPPFSPHAARNARR